MNNTIINTRSATLAGYGALLIWATAASLAAPLHNIPTLEVLAIVLSVCFITILCKLAITKQWKKIKQPLVVWFTGVAGIYGNGFFYIAAFKYAPAAQVDLINYLWPMIVFLLANFILKDRCTLKQVSAVLLGFSGVCILIIGSHGLSAFHKNYCLGYIFAFAGAFIWAIYTFMTRYLGKTIPNEMLGMYCGVGAILSTIGHFSFEHTTTPTFLQWSLMIWMGLTTQGLAYFLWDYGIKNGNYKLLSILAYGNPIISVFLLVLFGLTPFTAILVIASLFVVTGGILGGYHTLQRKPRIINKDTYTLPIVERLLR